MYAVELLDRAMGAEHGILVSYPTSAEGYQLRRKLYAERNKRQRQGITQYDGLSFVLKERSYELLIIQREVLRPATIPDYFVIPLDVQDLPQRIIARGKSRAGSVMQWPLSHNVYPAA